VFVLGAGADVAYGLPTIATLMQELAAFARGEGHDVHNALRSKLPHLRFTFDKYASDQGNVLLERLFAGDEQLIPTLRAAAGKLQKDETTAPVASMLEKMCTMAESNQLSADDLAGLAPLAGEVGDVGEAEPLFDPGKLSLTPMPNQALRHTFQQALIRGADLTDAERDAMEFFVVATSNIEQLLSLYFMKFWIGTAADRKTFLHLVWMLWAYLRVKSVKMTKRTRSIYARLPALGGDTITFNYTAFFTSVMVPRVKFFHGRLDEYLRADDRQLMRNDPALAAATDVEGVAEFITSLRLDVDAVPAIDIPAIVPPTAFKPVMTRSQLRTWIEVDDLLQRADQIVIVGYSFATADEHFNDLLRHANPSARIIVVNPDSLKPVQAAFRILGLTPDQLVAEHRGKLDVQRCGRLVGVTAAAENVNEALLRAVTAV